MSILGFGHLFAPVDQPYSTSLFKTVNLTVHTRVVNVAAYMKTLLPMVESGRIEKQSKATN